jgi:hypothetical protein
MVEFFVQGNYSEKDVGFLSEPSRYSDDVQITLIIQVIIFPHRPDNLPGWFQIPDPEYQ